MYGAITKFQSNIGVGVIVGEDGRAYRFASGAIRNPGNGLVGQEVYFDLSSRKAAEVIVLAGSPWTAFGGLSS